MDRIYILSAILITISIALPIIIYYLQVGYAKNTLDDVLNKNVEEVKNERARLVSNVISECKTDENPRNCRENKCNDESINKETIITIKDKSDNPIINIKWGGDKWDYEEYCKNFNPSV